MPFFGRRFVAAALAFAALTVLGTVGYVGIEGAQVSDAVYMTVITLTAVGYSEVFPLSPEGRSFTMALLVLGLTWLGVWFALITSLLVELDLGQVFRKRRTMKQLAALRGHVVVCGGGRTGRQVARELADHGAEFVLVESAGEQVEELRQGFPTTPVVEGDAAHDQVLLEAGVDRASGLVTCLSADADNLFVCLSARELNPDLNIIARAYEEETMKKLYRAGADHVVSPNVTGALRMASMLLRPSVVSFLDVATSSSQLSLRIEQATVAREARIAGHTLSEAAIPEKTGLMVIALRKHDAPGRDAFVFNPQAEARLEAGDEVIVLGEEEQIARLRALVS